MKRSGRIGRKQKIEQTIARRGRKENRWTMKITRNIHAYLGGSKGVQRGHCIVAGGAHVAVPSGLD